MAITALSTYSGVTPNKDTQTPTIFSAACDTSFSWIMTTLFTSINNFISQINTQLIPTSPTTVTSATYAVIDTDDAIIFNTTATCTLTLPASSPCTWGCFLVWEFPTYSGSVFPMHVGVFPGGDPHAVFKACLPHARGGVSR